MVSKSLRTTIAPIFPPFFPYDIASSQFVTARVFAKDKTIAPDTSISLMCEEYKRQKNQRYRNNGGKGKEIDEAIAVGLYRGK